jgi:hypothetical protein
MLGVFHAREAARIEEAEMSEKRFQAWGYRRGEAKIFDLREGETLPEGWSDSPPPGEHPNVPKGANPAPAASPAAKADEPLPWESEAAADKLPPTKKASGKKPPPE